MSGLQSLHDLPLLWKWYELTKEYPRTQLNLGEILAIRTCDLLHNDHSYESVKTWIQGLKRFFSDAPDIREDLNKTIDIFHKNNTDFTEILADIAQVAVNYNLGEYLLSGLRIGSDKANIATLRFLTAWTALNCNQLHICIEQCDGVDEPYAPIYTLQGQALLEIGKPEEAVEALNIATKLAPQEIMGWFQKARALHVLGKNLEAIDALKECEAIAPGNPEVALFFAMIADQIHQNEAIHKLAWATLQPHFTDYGHLFQVPIHLIRLAIALNDREKAQSIVTRKNLIIKISSGNEMNHITNILKQFQTCEWMDLAALLISKIHIMNEDARRTN